jgi:2,3-bisphosphoglycerate-independent phosphoglycerate mutase
MLIILDGWGIGCQDNTNAIALARSPVMDLLMRDYPWTSLGSAGEAVGLPPGQMGNSEVGHLNIGAGRLVLQDFQRLNHAIADGSFASNPQLISAIEHARSTGGTLHLLGLLSDGGVHSHIKHLMALIEMARRRGQLRTVTHAFLDGRDVPPRSALEYVRQLGEFTKKDGAGHIRTIAGRYYAMDRDNRWDRTKLSYDAIVHATGPRVASAVDAVEQSYAHGKDDEFLIPCVVAEAVPMEPRDSVIYFNFRPDRPRQLAEALIEPVFDKFDRGDPVFPYVVTMTEYDERYNVPVAFPPMKVRQTLADVLAEHGKSQLHIAETEKYAHVTYFFNGGIEEPKVAEDRVLIPSPKVATYDMKPEMSAYEVTDEVTKRIETGKYDFIVLNFANGDMVGHSGLMEATVRAVETVDTCLGKVLDAAFGAGGAAFVTADHGNADKMLDDHHVCTAHSTSRVPFVNVTPEKRALRTGGSLGDIAPTVLEEMELPKPREMTGTSLFLPVANRQR